jgi:hypothetical protein
MHQAHLPFASFKHPPSPFAGFIRLFEGPLAFALPFTRWAEVQPWSKQLSALVVVLQKWQ